MSASKPHFINLPDNVAQVATQWPVKITRSTTKDEHIATIVTPQKTFEFRHYDAGLASAKCEEQVRAAELAGEIAPDVF